MTPTFGDFLTAARQRITAAAQQQGHFPVAAHVEVICELDRLLSVIARYARDGVHPAGAGPAPAVATMAELTTIGIRLTLERAASSIRSAAQATGMSASTGHPTVSHLRAASDSVIAGRDLLHTHDRGTSRTGTDPVWAAVLAARPVTAALMRELSDYSVHLAYLTARLSQCPAGDEIPPRAQEAVRDTARWLTLAASPSAGARDQPGPDAGALLLHSIPANLPPPRHSPAAGHGTADVLCAGATATATRLRQLALRPAGEPGWPSASAAACWRHNALAAAIIGHTSELLLHTLTDRADQLATAEAHGESLRRSAEAMKTAWQSWQAVARAWNPLTTGTSRPLSPIAAELDDLVLWIGRLARESTWTPARSNTCPPRRPADLAPEPAGITTVVGAISHATHAIAQVARQDASTAAIAAAAGRIYSPARLLPESDDLIHIYRHHPASPGQITALRAAYASAITATEQVTATLDSLLTATGTAGQPYPLARVLQRSAAAAQSHRPSARAPASGTPVATDKSPGTGDIERVLHELKVSDPELLLRAIALDHATRAVTAEALTKALERARACEEATHAASCHSNKQRNRSAHLAAQDLPELRRGPASTQPATPVRDYPAEASQRKPTRTALA